MAVITAQQDGLFSSASTWTGGVVPGDGDTAETGNYAVQLDISIDLGEGDLKTTGTGYYFHDLVDGEIPTIVVKAKRFVVGGTTATAGHFRINQSAITLQGDLAWEGTGNNRRALILAEGTLGEGGSTALMFVGDLVGGPSSSNYAAYLNNHSVIHVIGDVTGGSSSSAYGIYLVGTYGYCTVKGNVTGASAYGIYHTANGRIQIEGDVTGGYSTVGIYNSSTGTVEVTGNVYGGIGASTYGIRNISTGTVEVIGNVYGGIGASTVGIYNSSTGTVEVTGNVYGGIGASTVGIYNSSTGTVEVTGNVYGGSSTSGSSINSHGIRNISTGTVEVTGNVYGGQGTSSDITTYGVYNSNANGIFLINGDVYPGCETDYTVPGVSNNGFMTITGTIFGSLAGPSYPSKSSAPTLITTKTSETKIYRYVYGPEGDCPIQGRVIFMNVPDNLVKVRTYNDYNEKILGGALNEDELPAPEHVRLGVVYNYETAIGTCAVPGPESVAAGVPIDDTLGTAVLTPEKIDELKILLDSLMGGEIQIDDDTPEEGYATLKYYTDEETPILYKTIVVDKTTGARSQAS